MKRFLIAFLTLLILLSLASCTESHEHRWKEAWEYDIEKDYEHHWHACEEEGCPAVDQKEKHQWQYLDGTADAADRKKRCSVCGLEVTEQSLETDISPYTVTEEQWSSALDMKTFPSVVKQHVYYPNSNGTRDPFIYFSVVEVDGNKVYRYYLDKTLTKKSAEWYLVKDGDSYSKYFFDESENKWAVEESSESVYNLIKTDYVQGLSKLFAYEDFEFFLNDKTYRCAKKQVDVEGQQMDIYNAVLTFKNGRLESYYFEAEIDGYNAVSTTFDYTPKQIVLPKMDSEESGEQPSGWSEVRKTVYGTASASLHTTANDNRDFCENLWVGAPYTVTATDGTWYKVEYPHLEQGYAYVMCKYVTDDIDDVTFDTLEMSCPANIKDGVEGVYLCKGFDEKSDIFVSRYLFGSVYMDIIAVNRSKTWVKVSIYGTDSNGVDHDGSKTYYVSLKALDNPEIS